MTNYLPFRQVACSTVLLEQHAGHFSSEFDRREHAAASPLGRLLWQAKSAWVRRSVRRADALIVQTEALADAMAAKGVRARSRIHVVPHGPGQVALREAPDRREPHANGPWRIGYPVKFGVQKDFDTLFRAARRLDTQWDYRIVLTLDPAYAPAAAVLRRAGDLGIGHRIENWGEVPGEKIATMYDSLDAMAFTSLVESFGFPMVEGMARALPLVAADTVVNREIAGGAALFFRAGDDEGLARRLTELLADESERRRCSAASLVRARAFSWRRAAEDTLSVLERTAAHGVSVRQAAVAVS